MFCGNFSCGRMAVYLIESILEAVCSNGFLTQHAMVSYLNLLYMSIHV